MALLLSWIPAPSSARPFITVLQRIPASAGLVNVVVHTSLLSALNSNLCGASRILFSLAKAATPPQPAPGSGAGVPRRAVLASVSFGFIAVILDFLAPDRACPSSSNHRRHHPRRLDRHRHRPLPTLPKPPSAPPAGP
jgi:aromatic amino acid permease